MEQDETLRLSLERQKLADTLDRWDRQNWLLWLGVIVGVVGAATAIGLTTIEGDLTFPTFAVGAGMICGVIIAHRRKETAWMYPRQRELEQRIERLSAANKVGP